MRMSKRKMWTSRISTITPKVDIQHENPEWLLWVSIWPFHAPGLPHEGGQCAQWCAGLLEGEPQEALKGFKEVISMEGERGEWCVSCNTTLHPKQLLRRTFFQCSAVGLIIRVLHTGASKR